MPEILSLLSSSLGWNEDDRHRQLFEWKHTLNPFGASAGWIAEDDEGIAGLRTFLRWGFVADGTLLSAMRAVDTATHPRARGRGIFRSLTMQAVRDAESEGVSFVFNTPNAQSAPGYLSMGWKRMGRVPVSFWPGRISVLPRLVSNRTPSELWSIATSLGESAADVFTDSSGVGELLTRTLGPGPDRRLRTEKSVQFLQWRYGQCPVGYRVLLAGPDPRDGLVVFRFRRRGSAREAVIADTLVPAGSPARQVRKLHQAVIGSGEADYGVALGASRPERWVPVPRSGPLLTWRGLAWRHGPPSLPDWNLGTGDIELF